MHDAVNIAHEALVAYGESLKGDSGRLLVDKDPAMAIAALVRSLDTAQERLRIHRGKPLPGSLRPTKRAEQGVSGCVI